MADAQYVDNGRFPELIRGMIRASGKSQAKVAVEAGMTPEQLSDTVNNRRWLRATELERIQKATRMEATQ